MFFCFVSLMPPRCQVDVNVIIHRYCNNNFFMVQFMGYEKKEERKIPEGGNFIGSCFFLCWLIFFKSLL